MVDEIHWVLTGLDCADCALKLERGLASLTGVQSATVNFAASTLTARYDPAVIDAGALRERIASLGYGVAPSRAEATEAPPPGATAAPGPAGETGGAVKRRLPVDMATVGAAGALTLAGLAAERLVGPGAPDHGTWILVARVLYAAAIVAGGRQIARRAWGAARLKTLDMNVLMTAAVIGAAILGEWSEGAAVVVLFALGNALENRTLERARRGLKELISLAPATARVRRDGSEVEVVLADIRLGDEVVVRPGERVPTDGVVREGSSAVEEAAVTGEPLPVTKQPGDRAYAGSLNGRGFLVIEATRTAADNTVARIVHLIEEAQAQKAPTERTVERFSRYYTPAVLGLAVFIAVVPPVLGAPLVDSVRRALVMLVIACPCALVISTPVSVVSALSAATRAGALIKGGRHLEAVARVRAVAFDKTGTLTEGRPRVERIDTFAGLQQDDALSIAAAVERRAHHPLAQAIVTRAEERGIPDAGAVSFEAVTGQGATAVVRGRRVMVGSAAYLAEAGCSTGAWQATIGGYEREGKTVVVLGEPERCLALFVVADPIRAEAAVALQDLKAAGIRRLAMLTGDSAVTARAVAAALPIDDVLSGLLPEEKVMAVEQLERYQGAVAMVGDGINDAPALAVATVGIAMGVIGSDTALETAEIALMSDELAVVPFLYRLARRTVSRIRENVALSILIKAAFLVLAATGQATLWMAVFADMGTSLLVTFNGMRLLRARPTYPARVEPGT